MDKLGNGKSRDRCKQDCQWAQCCQHCTFQHFTELCFLQDCYFSLEHLILMTTAYDRKLVQNLCYTLSSSLVDMVEHALLVVVHHLLFWWKGPFHCPQHLHFLLDARLVTECNKTQLINSHITHIIWLLSISAVNTAKYIPQIDVKFHHFTELFPTRLLPPLIYDFNNSLWQEINTEPVPLNSSAFSGGSKHFSSNSSQSIPLKKGWSQISPVLPSAPRRFVASLVRYWK
jgi:hypothetical protein